MASGFSCPVLSGHSLAIPQRQRLCVLNRNYRCLSENFISTALPLQHAQRVHGLEAALGPSSRVATRTASARDAHRLHVAVQPRPGAVGDLHHHSQHPSHLAAAPGSSDDSLKIIMLLSLSLTLMLLPWMSRHPEFLIVPALLAITPVVGNGVRPLLKEVITSFLTTLRLSFGVLTHHEQQQLGHDTHHHHHHGNHHQQHGHHRSHGSAQHHQQPVPQGPYSHLPQQQQHPAPAGPYSPWPNPARPPATWPQGASPAAKNSTGFGSADADDWAPSSPPDPHHLDPHSQQHLQQVLAADQQIERELGTSLPAAAAGHGGRLHRDYSSSSSSRSPSGSPSSSMDGTGGGENAAGYRSSHHHHVRDPRLLTKEAKQQLYHVHHQQQQAATHVQQRK